MSLLAEIPGLMPSGITGSVVRLEGSILAVAESLMLAENS